MNRRTTMIGCLLGLGLLCPLTQKAATTADNDITESLSQEIATLLQDDKKPAKATAPAGANATPPAAAKKVISSGKSMFHITKEGENWFFEIPDSLMGRLILAVTRYTATPADMGVYGGEEVREQTVYFELSPEKDQLFLKSSILANHADTLDVISKAVGNSTVDPIIGAFKIEKTSPRGFYKINVTSLLLQDNSFSLTTGVKNQLRIGGMSPNGSYIESVHSYPVNTEIRTVRTYFSSSTDLPAAQTTSMLTFGLNVSLLLLPQEPMRARIFDPRVGYFADSYNVFSDHQQQVENKKFVCRWRLEPKKEDIEKMKRGELVEPKKQIVYYIDPATPKKWRPYLIQGVNDWNKAFEKAGFKNAIVAKEWPDSDKTMSLEDARFAVIRYLASPIANAYGPQVHDPRSGEILESHVGWYHNVMSLVHDWYMIQASNVDPKARSMRYDDELMGQLIRFVSSHEIGHTLGLRHNFGSSSTVPVENLRNKEWVKQHGHTPSIMDYARFNYVAQPEDGMTESELFPRINDYDLWAIEWGYRPIFNATDAESDRYEMNKITTQRLAGNHRLWWGDGEGTNAGDPRCQTEDLGDDAVKASEYGIQNLKREITQLPTWTYWGNDTHDSNLKGMYSQLTNQLARYCGHVMRNLFGTYIDYKSIDEKGGVYSPTPRAKEKSVLPFFNKEIFTEPDWLVDVPYISRLMADKNSILSQLGSSIVTSLTSPYLLNSLNSNYPIQEYLPELTQMLFKELTTHASVTTYRRALQRAYVNSLTSFFNGQKDSQGSDALSYVLLSLRDLQKRSAAAAASMPDAMSRAHFTQLSDQITRALVVK